MIIIRRIYDPEKPGEHYKVLIDQEHNHAIVLSEFLLKPDNL